ncbi:MAG: hypothetical protein OXU81_08020 [Gammaproteobacteria bacterium]|nr:hypothetical protein [Gammaproteobacteria bacterium]
MAGALTCWKCGVSLAEVPVPFARVAPSFEAVAREVFELKRTEWKNAKHTSQWIGSLEEFAFPRLAKRSIVDIDANDVLEVLKPLLARTPTTAKRLRQRIAIVLAHAVARGLRPDNPAEAIAATLRRRTRGDSRTIERCPTVRSRPRSTWCANRRHGRSRSSRLNS